VQRAPQLCLEVPLRELGLNQEIGAGSSNPRAIVEGQFQSRVAIAVFTKLVKP
jgi:hypothetical protein